MNQTTMYSRWARYYDLLYAAFKDYEFDAARLTRVIRDHHPSARTLLDVACGTGQHLRHFRKEFDVEGLDANEEFFDIVHSHSPGIGLHCGRMESFRLGKRYDVVTCLFSSIAFVRTAEALEETLQSFAAHLNPGGLLIIEPWFSLEQFWTGKINAHFIDQPDLKIAWMYTTAVENGMSILANEILVGTPEGLEKLQETHVLGLFSHDDYIGAMRHSGLDPVLSIDFGPEWKRGLHVAMRRN